MHEILSRIRWFFTGVRMLLPLVPGFVWTALSEMYKSTVEYWKNSQSVVNKITDSFTDDSMEKLTSEYDTFVFWTCYSLASFLYLLGWLAMSWLTVEAFRMLTSWMF